ncbi:zf-HC2 domain-containing protein [Dyella sp. 2HG41-7]|uniref:anti-sigma factor family protein n=1 Tax=Dyella sp. 2HG41-7 TaxID=2883239 RepID=UPI001F19F07B|nr:zf-HC2 domain-containing protein [Dyella sp. 2HG41-7]
MTFPIDSSKECVHAWEAMPWVIQDTATPAQRDELKHHLQHCEACRAEFEQQQRLRLALALPSDVPVDANAGLQRLLGRLDMPDLQDQPVRPRAMPWLSRALVATVLIQALGIGILGVKLWPANPSPAYHTYSQVSAPVAAGAIRVVPDTTMTITDWNTLLHTLQLQVVGGPNEVGAYTVAPAASASPSAQDHALQQLRATRGIRLAEPVSGTP